MFFINAAHASPAAPAGPSIYGQLIMIAGFVAIFYFMIWRPQAKRNKEHRQLVSAMGVGNEVVFAGGLVGTVKSLSGDYVTITLNKGSEVVVQKAAVISILPEGTLSQLG